MLDLAVPAQFDADYLRRLKQGEPGTQRHFSEYFGLLLQVKLTKAVRSWQMLQDVRQETLLRVLEAVRGDRINQPEGFGAFVCATANHVLWEHRRAEDRARRERGEEDPEPIDERIEIERELVSQERKRLVENVLSHLSPKDRKVLRLVLLEERDKTEVCRELGVAPDYLRVVLYRAKRRFRERFSRSRSKAAGR
jgi:RNA polymerase sigma-70 factor (ECF subfamily)